MKTESELLQLVCDMYNDMDTSKLEKYLSEDLVYESQWVLTPLIGKESFINFFAQKFEAVRKAKAAAKAVTHFSENQDRGFVALYQGSKDAAVCVLIKCENGLIKRIDLVAPG